MIGTTKATDVVRSDDVSVEALAARIKQLEGQLGVALAPPEGYPITHFNVYVEGHPIASPDTLQDALSLAAMAKIQSLQNGAGIPETKITKRTINHPLRNDSVTEEEVNV